MAGQTARAAPDGYTLLAIPSGHAVRGCHLQEASISDDRRLLDDQHDCRVSLCLGDICGASDPNGGGPRSSRARSERTLALRHSGKRFASAPVCRIARRGSTKLQFQHVPYRGPGQSVTDLLGRRIDFVLDPPTAYLELIKEGRLRAIAVSGVSRFFALPPRSDNCGGGRSRVCRNVVAGAGRARRVCQRQSWRA